MPAPAAVVVVGCRVDSMVTTSLALPGWAWLGLKCEKPGGVLCVIVVVVCLFICFDGALL